MPSDFVDVRLPRAWYVLCTRHQHEKTVAQILTGKDLKPFYLSAKACTDGKTGASVSPCPCFRVTSLLKKKNIYRLVLSVEMLGKSAAVEIDAFLVERLNAMPPRYDICGHAPASTSVRLKVAQIY